MIKKCVCCDGESVISKAIKCNCCGGTGENNLMYVGQMFNEILKILNHEAPTWEWDVKFGYTAEFTHKQTGISLPMHGMHTRDLIDTSKYNIREMAKGIARSASELFLYKARMLELEELDYRMDGASFTFNAGDVLWVKPRREIWVEPDKFAVIYSDGIQTVLQDKNGKLVSHLEPITFTILGNEKLVQDFEWRDPLIKCPFCDEYIYMDFLDHLAYHRKDN